MRRDEVLTLWLKWRKPIPLEEAARWLGLPEHVTLDLTRVGLLTAEHGPDVDESSRWMFSKGELDRYYRGTMGRLTHLGHIHTSDLTKAARALSAVGLSAADILKYVADGELKCASYRKSPALADLIFDRFDIDALLKEPKSGSGLLCCKSVACRMGVETWTFLRWLDAGLLSPALKYAYEEYFDPHQIDDFLANHVFSRKAAQILGVEVEALQDLVWEGQLDPVWGSELQGYIAKICGADCQ